MQTPFPESVDVPYGLVTIRTILTLPPWVFVGLLVVGMAPLYLWGRSKWWVSLLALGLGMLVALLVKDDPQLLATWREEFGLKPYYD